MANQVFNTVLLCMYVLLSSSACKGNRHAAASEQDTVILASHLKAFKINEQTPFYQAELTFTGEKFSKGKKVWLLLDHPVVVKNPEGVYEVYLTAERNFAMLISSHRGFVNVLDLYALTDSGSPSYIAIDISNKWAELNTTGKQPSDCCLTVLFRGNSLNGVESKQAGEITVRGFRVVQIK